MPGMHKKASSLNELTTAQQIMEKIRSEDPSYWPHGLETSAFDGGLWLVSKSASHQPIGFVGWQNRLRDRKKVGYYVIGILPEYRNQGFAKQAVAEVIRLRSPGCDEVRALIMEHNAPSLGLGRSLQVPIEEVPMRKAAGLSQFAKATGYGLALASLMDAAINKDKGALGYIAGREGTTPWSLADFALNTAVGPVLASPKYSNTIKAIYPLFAGVKTIGAPISRNFQDLTTHSGRLADAAAASAEKTPSGSATPADWSTTQKALAGGALGLGAVGLIAAVLNARKRRQIEEQSVAQAGLGRVKVTLPTKRPGDAETTIDVPIEEINMSAALRQRLGRDTRRRLYEETKARTRVRKPRDPNAPTERELLELQLDQEMQELDKAAAQSPAPGMPSPPSPIGNPALRMVQQEQAAGAAPTQTAQNPQITQAQQQAAEASQQLQQQQSDAQMQVQQAQMDAQAQAQQAQQAQQEQMMQLQHKLNQSQMQQELLKLQAQKAKVEVDLYKQMAKFKDGTSKAMDAQGKGQLSDAGNLLLSRIARLRGKVVKAATAAEPPAPADPTEGATPYRPLGPTSGAVQKLNDDPSAISRGILHRAAAPRVSYGGVGDWVYQNFLRNYTNKPRASRPLPPMFAANSRDIMGTVSSYADAANELRQNQIAQGQMIPTM